MVLVAAAVAGRGIVDLCQSIVIVTASFLQLLAAAFPAAAARETALLLLRGLAELAAAAMGVMIKAGRPPPPCSEVATMFVGEWLPPLPPEVRPVTTTALAEQL